MLSGSRLTRFRRIYSVKPRSAVGIGIAIRRGRRHPMGSRTLFSVIALAALVATPATAQDQRRRPRNEGHSRPETQPQQAAPPERAVERSGQAPAQEEQRAQQNRRAEQERQAQQNRRAEQERQAQQNNRDQQARR